MNHLSAKTLFHRDDVETSREAAVKMVESGKLSQQEQVVLDAIKWYKKNVIDYRINPHNPSFTAKELSKIGIGYHLVQRRFSGLYRKGKIERTGEKRDGCCVWRLIKER